MKQTLIDTQQFTPQKLILEGISSNKNPIVEGILATVDKPNGNGRYYSRDIWEREINKYIDGPVRERRSLGETDHCFIDGYKILTKEKGWVDFKHLNGNEFVATLNPSNSEMEYQQIQEVINKPYEGEIINIESKTFQAQVTPNHNFITTYGWGLKNNKGLEFKKAEDLKGYELIPKKSKYLKPEVDFVTISNEYGEVKIPSYIFAPFMGWWLAEGYVNKQKESSGGINIPQKENNKKYNELKEILIQLCEILDVNLGIHGMSYAKGVNVFSFTHKVLNHYLRQFGICDEKFIPKEVKYLDVKNIEKFLETYLWGDGTKSHNQEIYYTSSHQMALDLIELINLTGWMASISDKLLKYRKFLIEDKWINEFEFYKNKDLYKDKIIAETQLHYTGRILYTVTRKYSKYYHLGDCEITKSQYKGSIHCVTVPNHTILVMSPNGSTFWSGNSDSEVVLIQNASHLITEIWWGGDNIMGKVEILPTPMGNILKTLLENQVTLGISSRGLGSVQQMGEILEVQDDFELVTFDFVSTPSNSNSWFKMNLNENKQLLNDKLNYVKVNQILNNIIYNL